MISLSTHEAIVWWEFQQGKSTGEIAEDYQEERSIPSYVQQTLGESSNGKISFGDAAYVSRVLNRARNKIEKILSDNANSHRLDVESLLDYKGLLIGFDYQASAAVYIVFTMKLGPVVWYKHDSYAGKLCDGTPYDRPAEDTRNLDPCPKRLECREILDTIMEEYAITLRPDEEELYMTQQSIAIFNKLAAKEIPRYKRRGD